MMNKKHITGKVFVMTAVIGSLLITAMLVANTLWASRETVSATDDAVSAVSAFYLKAMADRRAKTITNLINNNFEQLEKVVAVIESEDIKSQEDLRETIGDIASLLSLSRLAVVDENNVVYTQYTTYTGESRHEFLAEEKMSDRIIRTVSLYGSSKQLCLAISTPNLFLMGKPFKACFVQIDIKDIVDLLAFDDQGGTFFGVYGRSGKNLSDTELGPVIKKTNFLDTTKEIIPQDDWMTICDNFENEEGGSITFISNGAAETISYVPIQDTGWEVAVLIRESVIDDQIREISDKTLAISRNQIGFTLISMLVFAGVLLLQLTVLSKEKIEAEKENSRAFQNMANTDSLTGVRNKHAYTESEAVLNQMIRENRLQELAVVVCDINGLKHVNDTLGHAAGDKLIKDACAMICEYFRHGAVFRVGGDEFTILLKGTGYDTMNEAIAALNRKVEANIAENGVVVSIGYSILKEGDRQVRDVFERADQMMYEHKKELKAKGAMTRES